MVSITNSNTVTQYTSLMIQQKLRGVRWEIWMRPPCSPPYYLLHFQLNSSKRDLRTPLDSVVRREITKVQQ